MIQSKCFLKQVDSKLSKTSMFLTVFMDRIYGLIGLITLMGIITLFRYNRLVSISPGMEKIVYFNLLLLSEFYLLPSYLLPKYSRTD